MDSKKIESMRLVAEKLWAEFVEMDNSLKAAGQNSRARYPATKDLKARATEAHAEYVRCAHGQIKSELDKIIKEDAPARAAAARSRSEWKAAKYAAQQQLAQAK